MRIQKLSKIVATMGPSSDDPKIIEELLKAGVNVFRFNMKHNVSDWHLDRIDLVQKVADKLGIRIGIMIDLQGSEIRTKTSDDKEIELGSGEELLFVSREEDFTRNLEITSLVDSKDIKNKYVIVLQKLVLESLEKGDKFSIEDGFHNFEVMERVHDHVIRAKILDSGVIGTGKSLNILGKSLDLPPLIEADLAKLDAAAKAKIDFVALSFVNSKNDIKILREEIKNREMDAQIVAKVESQSGLDNIDEIIEYSDALLIARGDLGVETPLEKLPYFQKMIIDKCREASKPVIVATQMLQSMVKNPLPTRAEAADVAGAVYDGTDAVMLSAESAVGKYPVKAVDFMSKISSFNELHTTADIDYVPSALDQTHAVVNSALSMLTPFSGVNIDKLVVGTETGYTARVFSSYRPKVPILALSDQDKTVETLTLSYGVFPIYIDLKGDEFSNPEVLIEELKDEGFLQEGETILYVHGKRAEDPGNINSLSVITVA